MRTAVIDSPRLACDLQAAARGGALLTGAGLVGVLSGGPARIGLLPVGGGAAHLTDLAIESAQDLALLSRDVAVVRGGDGQIWGLSDLAGTPRPRAVGRDARALVPSSGVAPGWMRSWPPPSPSSTA